MGIAYIDQGNTIIENEKSLKIKLSELRDHNPSAADTYNSMRCSYNYQEKYEGAVRMLEKSLKMKLLAYGNNQTNTMDMYLKI